MEVGIDRKKDEERESAMRMSQLGGLVGYERIFSIICSLMYPRTHWRNIPGSGPSDTSHHRRCRATTFTSSASVPSNRGGTLIIGYMP
jgi:hypothetical protein